MPVLIDELGRMADCADASLIRSKFKELVPAYDSRGLAAQEGHRAPAPPPRAVAVAAVPRPA